VGTEFFNFIDQGFKMVGMIAHLCKGLRPIQLMGRGLGDCARLKEEKQKERAIREGGAGKGVG